MRIPFHVVGVWREMVGAGDILALRGMDAPRGVEALGGGAVGWAVHRRAVIHSGCDYSFICKTKETYDYMNPWY